MHVLYALILTSWVFIFIVLLLHLILHTAQPAAVTTVAMETCGVSEEKALNRREKRWREEMRGRLRGEREKQEFDKRAARAEEWSRVVLPDCVVLGCIVWVKWVDRIWAGLP